MAHINGMFSWIDLATDDQDAAEGFYTSMFGLDSTHEPIEGGGHYVMLSKAGKSVAGIGGKPDPSMPTVWQSYISVDDIDGVTARVPELGGTVVMGPFDVMASGRMAIISDPTGAMVSLWQAGTHVGGEVFNEHGTLTWNELQTRDVGAAREFFSQLLGWTYSEVDMGGDGTYHVAMIPGKEPDPSNAGILDMSGVVPDDVPPHWDVYFQVDDVDAAIETLTGLGGSVVVGPMEAAVGRWAYCTDPQGAMFCVMTPAGS